MDACTGIFTLALVVDHIAGAIHFGFGSDSDFSLSTNPLTLDLLNFYAKR